MIHADKQAAMMQDRRARLQWVDAAKAVCILLVVLYHARHQTYLVDWAHMAQAAAIWESFSTFIKPLRMPLFFLLSGLLASRSLAKPWTDVARPRVYRLFYVYLIWAIIFAVIIPAFPSSAWSLELLAARLADLPAGISAAWYLWALAAFFLIGWATRHQHPALPLGLGLAAAIAALALENVIPLQQVSMLRCLVFFLAGLRFPAIVEAVAAKASPKTLALAIAVFAAATAASWAIGLPFNPLLDASAVAAGLIGMKLACDRSAAFCRIGAFFARHTLPIYLLHFPLLVALAAAANAWLPTAALHSLPLAAAFPIIAATVCVAVSLGLYRLVLAAGLGWLFFLPQLRPGKTATAPSAGLTGARS